MQLGSKVGGKFFYAQIAENSLKNIPTTEELIFSSLKSTDRMQPSERIITCTTWGEGAGVA